MRILAVWDEMQWQVRELNAGPCEGCKCTGGWQQVPEAALRSVRADKPAQGACRLPVYPSATVLRRACALGEGVTMHGPPAGPTAATRHPGAEPSPVSFASAPHSPVSAVPSVT